MFGSCVPVSIVPVPLNPYNPYDKQLATQDSQSQYARNMQAAYGLMAYYPSLEPSTPAPDPVVECSNEPSEFKWLKRRIDEILWHPRPAYLGSGAKT